MGYEYNDKRVSCGGCGGAGKIIFDDTCLSCYGSGNTTHNIKERCNVCNRSGEVSSSNSASVVLHENTYLGLFTNASDKWVQKLNALFKNQYLITALFLVVIATCIYSHFILLNESSDTIALGTGVVFGYLIVAAGSLGISYFAIGCVKTIVKLIPFGIGALIIWVLIMVFGNPVP